MADNIVKGFQTDKGLGYYDYNSLANKPTLINQAQIDAAVETANRYTDSEIAKLDLSGGGVQIELDTTLSVSGKAADAAAVGQALDDKLGTDQLQYAIDNALAQAKQSGDFKGEKGDDYVLTQYDKREIVDIIISEFTNVAKVGA